MAEFGSNRACFTDKSTCSCQRRVGKAFPVGRMGTKGGTNRYAYRMICCMARPQLGTSRVPWVGEGFACKLTLDGMLWIDTASTTHAQVWLDWSAIVRQREGQSCPRCGAYEQNAPKHN
eukprot:13154572-Ditylum_brightwellii.AAC.1